MVYLLKMVIFHSYVSLPEGVYIYMYILYIERKATLIMRQQSNTYCVFTAVWLRLSLNALDIYIWVCPQTVHPKKWWFICNVILGSPQFSSLSQRATCHVFTCSIHWWMLLHVSNIFQLSSVQSISKLSVFNFIHWLSGWWIRIPIVNYDHPQVLIVGIIVMGI